MALLTLADYARRHGVSKQAAGKWKAKSFLVMSGELVDAEASDEKMRRAGRGPSRGGQPRGSTPDNPGQPVDRVDRASADAEERSVLDGEVDGAFVEALLRGNFATQIEADRVKANALAALRVVELQKRLGTIVELELAESVLFEQARAWRDSWTNWPSRVAPMLAADLGLEADRVTEVLTTYVHQHLAQLGEPDDAAALFSDREG